jgi:excisionase family DNA binding protein
MAVFNKREAAQYLRVSVETVDRFRDQGKLAFSKIGKRVIFTQKHLDEFIDALTIPAQKLPTLREQQIAAGAARRHLREAVFGETE